MRITLGADPEYFIWDTKKQLVIPAHTIVKNKTYTAYGSIISDGVALELNPDPSTEVDSLINNIAGLKRRFRDMFCAGNDLTLLENKIVVGVGTDYPILEVENNIHTRPSWNAYTGIESIEKYKNQTTDSRSAGGHIYIGTDKENVNTLKFLARDLVILLDYYISLPVMMMGHDVNEHIRRIGYGKAGSYRLPGYGIEYRVLSNKLFGSYSADLAEVLTKVKKATKYALNNRFKLGPKVNQLNKIFSWLDLQSYINYGNVYIGNTEKKLEIAKALLFDLNKEIEDNYDNKSKLRDLL